MEDDLPCLKITDLKFILPTPQCLQLKDSIERTKRIKEYNRIQSSQLKNKLKLKKYFKMKLRASLCLMYGLERSFLIQKNMQRCCVRDQKRELGFQKHGGTRSSQVFECKHKVSIYMSKLGFSEPFRRFWTFLRV